MPVTRNKNITLNLILQAEHKEKLFMKVNVFSVKGRDLWVVSHNFIGVTDNPTKQSFLLFLWLFFSHRYQSNCFSEKVSVSISAL